jgi:hypothetical protein
MPVVSRSRVQCGHVLVVGECLSERQVDRLVWCIVRRYAPRPCYFELVDVEDAPRHGDAPELKVCRGKLGRRLMKLRRSNFFEISCGPKEHLHGRTIRRNQHYKNPDLTYESL